jgi:metal-dependent amidase/aminoacylase/carboxypeptidase family protein
MEAWPSSRILLLVRYAHDTLTAFMASHGFEVTKHYKDMPTAWRAAFTHKSSLYPTRTARNLGVNSEMDALPGIGHACGHNLIAVAGVGVALAVKAALEKHDVSGSVVLLGTPGEEGGQGKVTLIERGAYKEMHACVMCVPLFP